MLDWILGGLFIGLLIFIAVFLSWRFKQLNADLELSRQKDGVLSVGLHASVPAVATSVGFGDGGGDGGAD
ncbi:hypothetical protein [Mesorhizobium amorphae]